MNNSGIRRNQGRWHTLKLSCIARIAKTDGALGNTILACLVILLALMICMIVTESYLTCVVVNTLMVVIWGAARRAHYQVVLPAALAAASLALVVRLFLGGYFMCFVISTANFMIALRPELFRRWRYPKSLLPAVSVISCVVIIAIQPIMPTGMLFNNKHNMIPDWIPDWVMYAICGYVLRRIIKQVMIMEYGPKDEEDEETEDSNLRGNTSSLQPGDGA